MTKFTPFLLSFSLLFLATACGGIGEKKAEDLKSSDFNTVSAADLYEISVPAYMKETTGLNVDASMQYQNTIKETYLAIIDEDKEEFGTAFRELGAYDTSLSTIGNYRKVQIDYFVDNLTVIRKGEPQKITINGMEAEQIEFTASVAGVPSNIFYIMTFVEGKEDIYMIMAWTLSENEDKYKDTLYTMSNSFNEL